MNTKHSVSDKTGKKIRKFINKYVESDKYQKYCDKNKITIYEGFTKLTGITLPQWMYPGE
jgi:hypothetical protein